jgi:flagellar biogenesis protein FliO
MQGMVTIVSSLGFPIAMCIFVCWYVMKQNENYRQDIKEMQIAHREEIEKLTKAINKLCDKLDEYLKGGNVA